MLSTRKNIEQYLSRDTETDVGAEESGNSVKPGIHISLWTKAVVCKLTIILNFGSNLYMKLSATLL